MFALKMLDLAPKMSGSYGKHFNYFLFIKVVVYHPEIQNNIKVVFFWIKPASLYYNVIILIYSLIILLAMNLTK